MDALFVAFGAGIVGTLLAALVGSMPDSEHGTNQRPARTALNALLMVFATVLVGIAMQEDERGTLVPVLETKYTGANYVYQGNGNGFQTHRETLVVELMDQDNEFAWYEVDCKKLRGGCGTVPFTAATPFSFIPVGAEQFQVVAHEKTK